jgi:hypothetical protein
MITAVDPEGLMDKAFADAIEGRPKSPCGFLLVSRGFNWVQEQPLNR